jgi:hypothetical protein
MKFSCSYMLQNKWKLFSYPNIIIILDGNFFLALFLALSLFLSTFVILIIGIETTLLLVSIIFRLYLSGIETSLFQQARFFILTRPKPQSQFLSSVLRLLPMQKQSVRDCLSLSQDKDCQYFGFLCRYNRLF